MTMPWWISDGCDRFARWLVRRLWVRFCGYNIGFWMWLHRELGDELKRHDPDGSMQFATDMFYESQKAGAQ